MNLNHPLRLAVGSHQAGSGKGCAMNVISWQNGDTTISDMPDCADPLLALVVQRVNDNICTHRDGVLLCSECSLKVLALAHRTVGTSGHGLTEAELHRVRVTIAIEQAESVAHLDPTAEGATARAVVRRWLMGEATRAQCKAAAEACVAAAYISRTPYDAYAAAATVASAAYAVYDSNISDTFDAITYAADASAGTDRLTHAHQIIDRFIELAPPVAQWEPSLSVDQAIEAMHS